MGSVACARLRTCVSALGLLASAPLLFAYQSSECTVASRPFNLAEKAAWCGLETAMSAVADIIEQQGCAATKGLCDVRVDTFFDGRGTGLVDNVDLTITMTEKSTKGEQWKVTGNGNLDNVSLDVDRLSSFCSITSPGEIPIDDDLHEDTIPFGSPGPLCTIEDKALEATTKSGESPQKYRQVWKYRRPNGGDGMIWVRKTRIAPDGAPDCEIILENLQADNYGEGLQAWGKLQVK